MMPFATQAACLLYAYTRLGARELQTAAAVRVESFVEFERWAAGVHLERSTPPRARTIREPPTIASSL